MDDFDDFARDWLGRLAECPPDVMARACSEADGPDGILGYLTSVGALSRVAARAVRLAHRGECDRDDLRQLVRPQRLRLALLRLAESSLGHDETPNVVGRPARRLRLGSRLGKYVLRGYLGGGGGGQVYLSAHESLRVPVAIKVFAAPDGPAASAFAAAFRAEAAVLAALHHPNVVRVFDAEEGETPFLVLEYVGGPGLHANLVHEGRLSPAAAFRHADGVARALKAAARQGVWHMDVKPSNVLVALDGTVKLADFGSARIRGSGPGVVFGTPPYMAPEQAAGRPGDRSDVYALGVMLYQMLGGELPFDGPTTRAVRGGPVPAPLEPLHRIAPGVPAAVSDLVRRMTEIEPDARPEVAGLPAELEEAFGMRSESD